MSEFGKDPCQKFNIQDIAQNDRMIEVVHCNKCNLVSFTVKTDIDAKTSSSCMNLYLHTPSNLQSKKILTTSNNETISNLFFATNIPGAEDSIMFIKRSGNGQQIWSLPLYGGESIQVTSFPLPIESFKMFVGRDHQPWLLACMNVYPSSSPIETSTKDAKNIANGSSSGIIFDSLMVRHWDTWNCYEKRNHMFLIPLAVDSHGMLRVSLEVEKKSASKFVTSDSNSSNSNSNSNSFPMDLMLGLHTDCPSKAPGHGNDSFAISPDGRWIALSCRNAIHHSSSISGSMPLGEATAAEEAGGGGNGGFDQMAWTTESSIFLLEVPLATPISTTRSVLTSTTTVPSPSLDVHPPLTLKRITSSAVHNAGPTFSPDSAWIAFTGMDRPQYESDKTAIHVYHIGSSDNESKSMDAKEESSSTAGTSSTSTSNNTNNSFSITADIDLSFSGLSWVNINGTSTIIATSQFCACNRVFLLTLTVDPILLPLLQLSLLQGTLVLVQIRYTLSVL